MAEKSFRELIGLAADNPDDLCASVDCFKIVVEWLADVAGPDCIGQICRGSQWNAAQTVRSLTVSLGTLCVYAKELRGDWAAIGLSDLGRDEIGRLATGLEEQTAEARELNERLGAFIELTGETESLELELDSLRTELKRLDRLNQVTLARADLEKQLKKLQATNREAAKVATVERRCELLARNILTLQGECLAHVSIELANSLMELASASQDLTARRNTVQRNREKYQHAQSLISETLPVQRLYFEANQKVASRVGEGEVDALIDRICLDLEALDAALRVSLVANEEAARLEPLMPVVAAE